MLFKAMPGDLIGVEVLLNEMRAYLSNPPGELITPMKKKSNTIYSRDSEVSVLELKCPTNSDKPPSFTNKTHYGCRSILDLKAGDVVAATFNIVGSYFVNAAAKRPCTSMKFVVVDVEFITNLQHEALLTRNLQSPRKKYRRAD
jgi:hypothetical protein